MNPKPHGFLCCGSGRQHWPLSRIGMLNQFLVRAATNSMFHPAVGQDQVPPTSGIKVGGNPLTGT